MSRESLPEVRETKGPEVLKRHCRGLGGVEKPSQRAGRGQEILMDVQEGSGVPL